MRCKYICSRNGSIQTVYFLDREKLNTVYGSLLFYFLLVIYTRFLYSLCGSSSSVNASKLTSVPGTNQYSVISVKFLSQGNSGVPGWDSNLRLTGSDLMFALLRTIKTLDLPYDIQIELFDKTIKPILL